MSMTVVNVGIMTVDVPQALMPVNVGVGLARWIVRRVLVPVMLVVT